MEKFKFENPQPSKDDYIFYVCSNNAIDNAGSFANYLAEKGCKLFFESSGKKGVNNASIVANAIDNCKSIIIYLSDNAINDLYFRNIVNYALNFSKPIICIQDTSVELKHGMDMQLANIKKYTFDSNDSLFEKLVKNGVITQDTLCEGMKLADENKNKKITFISIVGASIIAFIIGSIVIINNRINYYNSAEYVLKDSNCAQYVDATAFGEECYDVLSGMTIGELDLSNSNIESVYKLGDINASCINISGNPKIKNILPLFNNETLRQIKIDQSMINMFSGYSSNYEIIVVR